MNRIFVYGTLKAGFPNHDQVLKEGVFRLLGQYCTVEKFPLVIIGPRNSPVMFPEPGIGRCIEGEVYEVNDEKLRELDEIEYVHLSKGYRRVELDVVSKLGEHLKVEAYMRARKFIKEIRSEYLASYQDKAYVHARQRK